MSNSDIQIILQRLDAVDGRLDAVEQRVGDLAEIQQATLVALSSISRRLDEQYEFTQQFFEEFREFQTRMNGA